MATFKSGTVSSGASATVSASIAGSTQDVNLSVSAGVTFQAGTGANQANKVARGTLVPGGSDIDIDLSGGTQLRSGDDGAVAAHTFSAIKVLVARAASGNAADIDLNTTLANGWGEAFSGTIPLAPGAAVTLCNPSAAGWAVTAGTADLLRVSGTTTDSVDIEIIGLS